MMKVIADREKIEGQKFYSQYYSTADKVDILGITNRSFIEDLYPAYWDPANDKWDRTKAAVQQRIESSKLLKLLRERAIRFDVRLMNPYCTYIGARMVEAPGTEENCRNNIVEVINALRCLFDDLIAASAMKQIMGSISVSLIDKNPYFSVFRADPGPLLIGFITQEGRGNIHPSLLIPDGEEKNLLLMSERHLTRLDRDKKVIFLWQDGNVEFTEYKGKEHFDVFISYNSKDRTAVRKVESDLRWKGIRSWLDTEKLLPGNRFWNDIVAASEKARCAAVFFGPHGPGPYQKEREIPVLLGLLAGQGLKIIPVLLEGAKSIPNRPDSLMRELQWINFGEPESEPLESLVRAIQAANSETGVHRLDSTKSVD